eukprot:m.129523 g.129523  ORF g.129523 m.129523 type:complete len:653 (+) comp37983_c0_seq2:46-2004(+)
MRKVHDPFSTERGHLVPYREISEDPESRYDKLPQPFRFLAKVLNGLFETTWNEIQRRQLRRIEEESKFRLSTKTLEDWHSDGRGPLSLGRDCIIRPSMDGRHLFAALDTKILVLDGRENTILAELDIGDGETSEGKVGLSVGKFGERSLIALLTASGCLKLYCHDGDSQLFELRDMTIQDSLTDVKVVDVSTSGNFLSVFQSNGESSLSVFKIPLPSWVSDVNTAVQMIAEETVDGGVDTEHEISLTEKLAGKLAKPVAILKIKTPGLVKPSSFGNSFEMARSLAAGHLANRGRLGECHTLSEKYLEARADALKENEAEKLSMKKIVPPCLPSCLFTSQEFTSTESEFIFKWSNDNIVAFFSLHSQSKGEQVPYLSLPSVSAVSVLCISHDHRMLAIGHDNGFVSVYDKLISSTACNMAPADDNGAVTSLAIFPMTEKPNTLPLASQKYCLVAGLQNGSIWRAFFPSQSTSPTPIFHRDYDGYQPIQALAHCPAFPSLIFAQHGSTSLSVREIESGEGLCQFTLPQSATLRQFCVMRNGRLNTTGTGSPDCDLAFQLTHHLYQMDLKKLPELQSYYQDLSKEEESDTLMKLAGPGALKVIEDTLEKERAGEWTALDDYIEQQWESLAGEVRKLEEKRRSAEATDSQHNQMTE